ncbi:MAG TPA: heparan-alpha-glucosaminide N-acetyltransferase domain-containing protein [Pyrinomonadaceae bacterium]|nr:heparan-alpha-glucosaminide N-acetyltransferase domain-containing protein [Pyrinomonadaceae bacterium]
MTNSPQNSTSEYTPLPGNALPAGPKKTSRGRIDSIDLLRGIVMVIMMLDHTRDFVHYASFQFDPTDLTKTNVALFFTRWITHFCAPIFVFLAGTGAYLQFARGKSKKDLSRYLVARGFWLIALEFTLVRISVTFNLDYRFLGVMQVIWAIGVSMIVLAALIHLPVRVIAGFGVTMIVLHNLLDRFHVPGWRGPESAVPGLWSKLFIILHQGNEAFPILGWPSPVVFVLYPLIPWIGVMAAGYAFGAIYNYDRPRRRRLLLIMGSAATLGFVVLRAVNYYGDPAPWSRQSSIVFTVLSFLNTTKYPPSLLFLLMTLGPALLALAYFEPKTAAPGSGESGRTSAFAGLRRFFLTFGRVPLFFYLLQWPTAHFIAVFVHFAAGKPWRWMFGSLTGVEGPPPGVGFSLWVVYACWIAGVLLLYPLCKWFAGVKARRRDWWLSYL